MVYNVEHMYVDKNITLDVLDVHIKIPGIMKRIKFTIFGEENSNKEYSGIG